MLKLINTNECCNVYFIFAAKTCIHCTHAHSSETVRELKRWWNVKREATSTASTYIHSFMLLAEMHVHRVHCTACLWFLDVLIVRVLYGNVDNLLAEEHTHAHTSSHRTGEWEKIFFQSKHEPYGLTNTIYSKWINCYTLFHELDALDSEMWMRNFMQQTHGQTIRSICRMFDA